MTAKINRLFVVIVFLALFFSLFYVHILFITLLFYFLTFLSFLDKNQDCLALLNIIELSFDSERLIIFSLFLGYKMGQTELGCGMSCLKYLLFVVNFIVWVSSIFNNWALVFFYLKFEQNKNFGWYTSNS